MAANKWEIEFKDIEELEKKLTQIPGESERTLNDVIHGKGVSITEVNVRAHIPISTWRGDWHNGEVRQKDHARNQSFPTVAEEINLGFIMRPRPKYRYLVFPDLGVGTSITNEPQDFMAGGLAISAPKITEEMTAAVDDAIKRILGG